MSNPIQSFDDVLPNDGSGYDLSFTEPAEQVKEEQEAKAKAESYLPVLDELIADLEKDVADADSMTKLGINSSLPQIQVQIIVEGNQKYIAKLNEKLEAFRAMRESVKG